MELILLVVPSALIVQIGLVNGQSLNPFSSAHFYQ